MSQGRDHWRFNMQEIEGNFYGQDYGPADQDAQKLNQQNNGISYSVYTNMQAGGYQIEMFREPDVEWLALYDDGNQWLNFWC